MKNNEISNHLKKQKKDLKKLNWVKSYKMRYLRVLLVSFVLVAVANGNCIQSYQLEAGELSKNLLFWK